MVDADTAQESGRGLRLTTPQLQNRHPGIASNGLKAGKQGAGIAVRQAMSNPLFAGAHAANLDK